MKNLRTFLLFSAVMLPATVSSTTLCMKLENLLKKIINDATVRETVEEKVEKTTGNREVEEYIKKLLDIEQNKEQNPNDAAQNRS